MDEHIDIVNTDIELQYIKFLDIVSITHEHPYVDFYTLLWD